MPEIESHRYLIDWLFDVGPTMVSSMGSSPLTYQEIKAWGEDVNINPWEVSVLHTLSTDYLTMLHQGSEPSCPAPFVASHLSEQKAKQVSDGMKELFMNLAKR